MNKNLKAAFHQGMIIFLATAIIAPLIIGPTKNNILTGLLFGLFFGSIRAMAVYFYKKNTIEDESFVITRQKAQSVWFLVFLAAIPGIPELVIIYSNFIQNPLITFGAHTIPLDEMAWIFVLPACALSFIGLIGSHITEKILMRSYEK